MANYVWNKVVCPKETFEKYFIDKDPFGDGKLPADRQISFNKLFDVKTVDEYLDKIGVCISYSFGCLWQEREDGVFEIKFCTRTEYPIKAIVRTIELSHNTVWYAFEENRIYVSKFYWDDGVKEDVLLVKDDYWDWCQNNEEFVDSLDDPDDGVWHYLSTADNKWKNWETADGFARYLDVGAMEVSYPFK
ncbi:MAG: hypothetical protein K6G50_13350 [bacterium]|nr:hypothetical protein [bacterium]